MNIRIYQINPGRDSDRLAFQGLDEIGGNLNSEIYDCVYEGDVDCKSLEGIFEKFNHDRPEGCEERSLSVSDIVEVIDSETVSPGFYYCDSFGFKAIDFEPEKAEPYQPKTIKVLMVEPGRKAREAVIGTSLEALYKALDCDTIQTYYPYEDRVVIVCDDEGKLNGARPNRAIYGEDGEMADIICGKFFICDCRSDYFDSLPDDMMKKYKEQFLQPEMFFKLNGEIKAVKFNPDKECAR